MENKSHLISTDNVAVGGSVSMDNSTAPFDTASASEATSGNSDCEAKQDSSSPPWVTTALAGRMASFQNLTW